MNSLSGGSVSASFKETDDSISLSLKWAELALADTEETLDVTVVVSIDSDSPLSRWTATIMANAVHFGVWEFAFPVIGNLHAGSGTKLVVPAGWGLGIDGPPEEETLYRGNYPSGGCVMQLICLTDEKESVYLATEDKSAYHKRFLVQGDQSNKSIDYQVTQFPGTMGHFKNSYETPYHTAVGLLPGDWDSAAKQYRAWALTAPWTSGGKIKSREDTDQWIKDNVLWARTDAMSPEGIEQATTDILDFADYFGVPTAVHWYSWHEIPFDDHYPEYFPAREGFKDAVASLQESDIHIMPYINGRLWDPRTKSWFRDGGAEACSKTYEQHKYVESYASKVILATMCPTTSVWQGKIGDIVERLAGEFAVDGVYIDQIGAAAPRLCFDRTHGHESGGGDYWVRGYETLIGSAKDRAKSASRQQFILTTEDAAEAYGAQLDAFLMCNSTRPGLVPLYPLVYSGVFLTFGRYIFEEDLEPVMNFQPSE